MEQPLHFGDNPAHQGKREERMGKFGESGWDGGEIRVCVPPRSRKFSISEEKVSNLTAGISTRTCCSVLSIVGTIVYSTTFSDIARMPHPASS